MRPSTALSQQENFEVPPIPRVVADGTKTVHLSLQINGEDLQEDYMDYDNSVSSERQCLE